MGPVFLLLIAAHSASSPAGASTLEVEIGGIRNTRGVIHVCVTRNAALFPDCLRDAAAHIATAPAATGSVEFQDLMPGRYAVAVFHDENGNGRLDTFVGIPREGFGFSRNPALRFGPPPFRKVSIEVPAGLARTSVRMQYLL